MNSKKSLFIAGNFLSKSTGVRGAGEDLADQLRLMDWKVITASSYHNRIFRLIDFMWTTFAKKNQYNLALVEVYSDLAFHWAEIVCLCLRILRKKYALVLHGGKLPIFALKHIKKVKKILASANEVVTPSKYLFSEFSSIRDNLKYIPNGINISKYLFSLRKQTKPKLVWFRAFHQIYNPTLAVETLAGVNHDFPDAELLMIGPDKGDGTISEIYNKGSDLGILKKIHLSGAVPKDFVSQYLNQGDIFLNTTNYESFGVSVLEAAACGLCIITTNVGELPYLWEDGMDVLLVSPNNPEAMAAAVKRLLNEPGLAERLSTNARRKAEQFDWANVIPKWVSLLNEIR